MLVGQISFVFVEFGRGPLPPQSNLLLPPSAAPSVLCHELLIWAAFPTASHYHRCPGDGSPFGRQLMERWSDAAGVSPALVAAAEDGSTAVPPSLSSRGCLTVTAAGDAKELHPSSEIARSCVVGDGDPRDMYGRPHQTATNTNSSTSAAKENRVAGNLNEAGSGLQE
ncbi:unnamed protein product [Cuscuta campestris]|uniref:Uncharacterized protein n=1 Tax=Cuscuta campestris TaxID=132261 RepID=A0A484M663_9ASTE|nr:unnamed protein product [Cuscuta campestris]